MSFGIFSFINLYETEDTLNSNFIVENGINKQYYKIPDNKKIKFWELYCDGMNCPSEKTLISIKEIPDNTYKPISVYITLKFSEGSKLEMDNMWEFCMGITETYQEAISKYLDISDEAFDYNGIIIDELTCCQLEPKTIIKEDSDSIVEYIYKSKIHFPYCCVEDSTIQFLRKKVIEQLRKNNGISVLNSQPNNEWETILQNAYDNDSGNYMYKSGGIDECILTLENIISRDGDYLQLDDVFSPSIHSIISSYSNNKDKKFTDKKPGYWNPMFLSVNYWRTITSIKEDSMNDNSETLSTELIYNEDLILIKNMFPMLSDTRINTRIYWLDIGRAIFNTCDGSEEGLELWKLLTLNCHNFTAEDCEEHYWTTLDVHKMDNPLKYVTKNTIRWYCKKDSPRQYNVWLSNHLKSMMLNIVKNGACDSDIGKLIHEYFCLKYICGNAAKNKWYAYNERNHRWMEETGHSKLSMDISNEFKNLFIDFGKKDSIQYYDKLKETNKEGSGNMNIENYQKEINKIIKSLGESPSKSRYLSEAKNYFENNKVHIILDNNINLLGVVNGVIESDDRESVFREGKPEDYITKHSDVRYREFSWDHPLVKQCMNWMYQCFVDEELVNYVLKIYAGCLRSVRHDKKLFIMTGGGGNSKSMVQKLINLTFGSYCKPIPKETFIKSQGGGDKPRPALARTKGLKVGNIQESDSDTKFQDGDIKMLTGGDPFFVRFLNENGFDILPTLGLFVFCNDPPDISSCGPEMYDRIVCIPFDSKWSNNAPKSSDKQWEQRHFPQDALFEYNTIPKLAAPFLWILVNKYQDYLNEGLRNIPKVIQTKTADYWDERDLYKKFIEQHIEPVFVDNTKYLNTSKHVNVKFLHKNVFKEWYSDYENDIPKLMKFSKEVFKKVLGVTGKVGEQDSTSEIILGYRLKDNVEIQDDF